MSYISPGTSLQKIHQIWMNFLILHLSSITNLAIFNDGKKRFPFPVGEILETLQLRHPVENLVLNCACCPLETSFNVEGSEWPSGGLNGGPVAVTLQQGKLLFIPIVRLVSLKPYINIKYITNLVNILIKCKKTFYIAATNVNTHIYIIYDGW